jgi:DNA processing protein
VTEPRARAFLLEAGDPRWPAGLSDLGALGKPCQPSSLWVEGQLPALPGVAVVGARAAGVMGQEVARRIGGDLGRRGVTVVSGFALGVDAAAHRGCLAAGGQTVAVLGCGLAVDYPRSHRGLRTEVSLRGALVSEYTAWDAPRAWRFPHRNRIIAALCRAVVVVEARERSGALSTARWAADLGREVLAVPGSILGPLSEGSNRLLRDGARPYLDVSDLADLFPECAAPAVPDLHRAARSQAGEERTAPCQGPDPVSRVLALVSAEPVPRELIGRALGLGAPGLAVLLGELELDGQVRGLPGGLVARARS